LSSLGNTIQSEQRKARDNYQLHVSRGVTKANGFKGKVCFKRAKYWFYSLSRVLLME